MHPSRKDSGIATIIVLSLLAVITLLMVGSTFTSVQEVFLTRNDNTYAQAAYVAQSGLQRSKTQLFQTYRFMLKNLPSGLSGSRRACSNILAAGLDWNRNGVIDTDETFPMSRSETVGLGAAGNGQFTYTITVDPNRPSFMTIQSVGTAFGARSTVQATFRVSNGGLFSYAIYAGQGSAARSINGGVTIRGGVYINGDASDPNDTVVDVNGNFLQANDYNLNTYGSNVASRVPSTLRVDDNLCATLRVKDGRIDLSNPGSAAFGTPSNKLLGFYVGDTNSDTIGGVPACNSNKGVCSDYSGTFDLDRANAPSFPMFSSPCAENPSLTWRGCFQNEAVTAGLRIVKSGSTISFTQPNGASVNNSTCNLSTVLSNTNRLTFNTSNIDCTYAAAGTNPAGGFRYTGSTTPALLEVYGTVNFAGFDVVFSKDTDYRAYNYAQPTNGRAASFIVESYAGAGGNMDINGSVLPGGTSSADLYPSQVLSLIAENNIYQRGQAVMGVIYSGGTYRNVKDNVALGNVIANQFCTTSAGNQTSCNAGQKSEVVYIDPASQLPETLKFIKDSNLATYQVIAYERR